MEPQEAIQRLQKYIDIGEECYRKEFLDAIRAAIDALGKQKKKSYGIFLSFRTMCPRCSKILPFGIANYCDRCGQAISWENGEWKN